jgi:ParB family chromosome partitioning protein
VSNNKGLGRGFDSLIPTEVEQEFDPAPAKTNDIQHIDVNSIDPNPHQPRDGFNQKELEALADSIQAHGILQPLVVQVADGRYQLIAGERRLRAAESIGLETVPAILRSFDEQQSLELSLIENIQREQLNAVETAAAYQKLLDQFNLSSADIAKRVGRDETTVKNTLRLLRLPTDAKHALVSGSISEGHARAILSVSNREQQEELLRNIIDNEWTVRRAEEFARDVRAKRSAPSQVTSETEATQQLGAKLDTKVQLQRRAHGGRVMIHYQDDEDLQRILDRLSG